MSGLGGVVRAGVARRRVAAVVTCLATLAATAAAVAATGLVIASDQPFAHAFAGQRGAELTAMFDGTAASATQLAATARANGVTSAAGPFPQAATNPHITAPGVDFTLQGLSTVGRADPGGPVDNVSLVSGHWVNGSGQIVLSTQVSPIPLGATVQFPTAPGAPTLTLVGYAQSVTDTADAWVEPQQAFALADTGSSPTYQMLYRFAHADTDGQMLTDRDAITAMLPKGALIGASTYLAARYAAERDTAPWVPFIVAFGILALATAVLIITNVVSGAVGAALFKIGVLKALGSTPAQVVRAYCLIALAPAAVGVVLGTVLGNVIATPLLRNAQIAYGTGALTVASWTDLAVPAAVLVLVGLSAVVPALRAGRLPATAALAVGRAPRAGRGRFVRRLLAALPLPQPIGLGLGTPLTRPARYLAVVAALVFGTVSLTFAVGLAASLTDVQQGLHQPDMADVTVTQGPLKGGTDMSAADAAAIASAISRQGGTASYVGLTRHEVTVLGTATGANATLYTAATTSPYQIITGRWYTGPGQVLVPTGFLNTTGTHVGDAITLVDDTGQRATVHIVGEVLDSLSNGGMEVIADAATFPGTEPSQFAITVRPGVDITAYLQSLTTAIDGHGSAYGNPRHFDDQQIIAVDAIAGTLTLLVVATAALGAFNTVMVELRDRIHELGVYKAVGMTPQQTIAMVLTATAAVGLIAGAVGVPAGIALHHYVIPLMGHAAGTDLPHADVAVFRGVEEVLLALAGVAIAVLAALVPAGWAARVRTATALRTE
jgi:putative ABC transport system permease protein